METVETPTYEKWEEIKWRRSWIIPYNDSGWIIGKYGNDYVVWLDGKNDTPVLCSNSDLAY